MPRHGSTPGDTAMQHQQKKQKKQPQNRAAPRWRAKQATAPVTLKFCAHGLDGSDVAQGFCGVAVSFAVRNVDLHVQLLAPHSVPLPRAKHGH